MLSKHMIEWVYHPRSYGYLNRPLCGRLRVLEFLQLRGGREETRVIMQCLTSPMPHTPSNLMIFAYSYVYLQGDFFRC